MNARLVALLREALPDISWRRAVDVRQELVAGLTGALLVIPQAITFAYLAGVPPVYGLYCAVFVGFLSSLFGNSPMVGGPNTAVSILLGVTAIQFAGSGSPLYIEFVLILSLLVGLIQLVIWLLRGAVLFRYFSPAAIAGIKTGIGVILITSALEGALGLSPLSTQLFYEKFYLAIVSWTELVNPYAATISAVTITSGLAGGVIGAAIGRLAPSFVAWLCTPGPKFLGQNFEPTEFGFGMGAVAGLLLGAISSTCLVIALAFRDARLLHAGVEAKAVNAEPEEEHALFDPEREN